MMELQRERDQHRYEKHVYKSRRKQELLQKNTKEIKTKNKCTKTLFYKSPELEKQHGNLENDLKCKISAIRLVEKACISLIFLNAKVQISMEFETRERQAGSTTHLDLYYPKTSMCRYWVKQHLLVPNLYYLSINKILAMEFITVKSSQNLNLAGRCFQK